MKVKYKQIKYSFCGDIYSYYIKLYKRHWWSLYWHIEMDGFMPARYDLIDNEYIKKL